jgi:hypothetical protein
MIDLEAILPALAVTRETVKERDCFTRDGETYGVRDIITETVARSAFSGSKRKMSFAEDACGNYFLLDKTNESVWFWDHETNRSKLITNSLVEFNSSLTVSPEVELNPDQVLEAWIDPEFLKSLNKGGADS